MTDTESPPLLATYTRFPPGAAATPSGLTPTTMSVRNHTGGGVDHCYLAIVEARHVGQGLPGRASRCHRKCQRRQPDHRQQGAHIKPRPHVARVLRRYSGVRCLSIQNELRPQLWPGTPVDRPRLLDAPAHTAAIRGIFRLTGLSPAAGR